jgi:hypothetical protein
MIRTYTDLSRLHTLEERFEYLALAGQVGDTTFGSERELNQGFYHSTEWRRARRFVIARDYGFDLGDPDTVIRGDIYVHHMNPLTVDDIIDGTDNLFNPEGLISVSHRTHNAIHYGDKRQLPRPFADRVAGDTRLW